MNPVSKSDDVNRRAIEYATSRPAVRELRAQVLELVAQNERGELDEHLYFGRLTFLLDQEARFIDAYSRGFREGYQRSYQRGLVQGQIQACQQLLGAAESTKEEFDQLTVGELEELLNELRQRVALSEIDPENLQ